MVQARSVLDRLIVERGSAPTILYSIAETYSGLAEDLDEEMGCWLRGGNSPFGLGFFLELFLQSLPHPFAAFFQNFHFHLVEWRPIGVWGGHQQQTSREQD